MGEPFPNIKSQHSLVAKHVTKEVWDKLGNHKTATSGFTLGKAIACAVEFDNQHCGIYAGDWDSYKDFAAVFDPIIQEYHGISPDAKHSSDMDVTKIKGNIDVDVPVNSVRIRVGRSIDGFGLSPGITKEQRVGVENLMKSAFKKMPGDLSGNYFPLTGMDEKIRQQLVDDHFLFMSGDPNLKVAGMERDWPEGRGIYHNKDKTFLVWVNEEDQLRIISMEMGGDVRGVFERLARGIKAVGDSVKAESGKEFCLDSKYGYVHSCPTNLGTGMRASVHVDLPGWTKDGVDNLKKRCEELKVQPRGTRGESGGQTGCTYDISNKHRLGYSEVELVQCMIDGVNTLYREDIELQKKHGIFPYFPEIKSKHSLVAKHVTEAKWKKLAGLKTATSGFTMARACACAIMFDNQHCGIYAGDWDSYRDFADVFDPIIQEYHGISADAKHTSDMDVGKIQGNIDSSVPVNSVRIRVGRSIDGFGLSPGITREQRLGVENLMKSAFKKLPGDLSGNYYPLLGMDEKVRQQLVDDHFLFMSGDPNLKVAGMERDWPEGRGIYHNAAKTFLVWVNEEDQLRIISMQMGGDVKGVFERLARGIKAVGDSVKAESGKDFCLDSKYGYVHSCPTNLGTGMRASVHVDLPGWTAEGLNALKQRCEELKVQPRGTRGESGGQTGCTYDISNKHRLGYSEVELVQCMIDGVNTLYREDMELQKKHKLNEAPPFPNIKSKHSLVAKYVTPEVWAKIGGIKTKTSGFTLSKAIACAVEFDNQHCGIYAGDWDSYRDFAAVFDPIIQEYHGISPSSKHTSNMDVTMIKGNINEGIPVHSVRIRVGRSIDGFGLSPGITKEQRVGVENLMKSAFQKLSGDLSGKYYPLTGMDEKIRQQLVDDHFLFMSGDANLKVAGMERDWPEGRGIYHNAAKSFLVWVNEEDQLRIISMEMGGDVRGVFERLARGIKAVGDSVKAESGKDFCLDAKYGYVHSCPTNLGTGMRASVHVDLPGWTKEGLDALKKRCEELKVQPRGTRGESGGQTGCTYDISNKHRLGYSEVELVQCMIDGVNTLYAEDQELQKKHGMFPYFPEIKSKHSLVAKHVTEERYKKLGAHKTATSGFTLQKAIACATMFDNQHCGIYAGDWDSYRDFAEIFDPIIQEYHGISSDAKHTSDMDVKKIKGNINSEAPVHSVRIRVGRSIDGFGLSPGITRQQRLGVENLMKNAFKKLPGDLSGSYYPLLGMDEKVRQQLVDDHFLFMSGDANLKVAGMERDWPEGRGIFHNSTKTFLVWVNEEDQLRIISMEMGGDVFGVFERLARGIKAVGDSVMSESGKGFMLDTKYGYVHSCPTNLGTGMRASVHVDLAGWTAEGLPALQKRCEELKVQPRGTRGESGGQTGCTYDISNKHRLGYSEVELVQCMIDGVNTLFQEDIALQQKHGIFPYFPEIKSKHSLVAKHVTPQVWKKLAAHSTATSGFTLRKACACALLFDNQHCGIYAGDWDSYKDFAAVFDPIIQEYHGIKPGAIHTSDMDVSKIRGNIDSSVPVHSVRIRVGRSIDGFGLSPGITREQRMGVESLMKSAFQKLSGDLSGNYYPLLGMDERVRQQLVDDHFLFVSGDPNLKVAGMERDWPEGRGIYHNAEKTFLVWVNEEDQLRIISMQKGGDVKGVFERLARGIKAVGDSVKAESGKEFALDPKYGYVHSCPTNLGTGMRASVHVDLPGWTAKGLDALKRRCEELKVQPRGTRGESGGQTGCTYDISNKHRLGYSEIELVQCMIDGVNTLYKEDLALQKGGASAPVQASGPAPPFPNIKSKHSLVAKYVTQDIWAKLGGHVTKTAGFTLSKAIACAVDFDNQHCGIYAGDWDSYKDFAAVFDPLIQEYHGIKPGAKHSSDMDVTKIKGNIDMYAPVHSVRIRVGRSIDGFGLSPGITREQRVGVETLMKSAFKKMPGNLSGNYYPLTGMDEKIRQQLVDDHFLFMSGDPNLKVAGMERDWPEGRGIYHNKDKTFLVWVNEEDQLRIISMEMGGDVKGVFERLARGIKAVGESVKAESGKEFCLDSKYGYVHSCPTNLGTGMRASVHVDLPGWTAEGLKSLQARCEELKVQPRGTRGESGGQTGCTYDISNKHRLGYSEVELVQCMIDGVNTLFKEDIQLQQKHGIYPHFPEIKSKHSLVAKHVTEARFKKLGAIKTKTSGFTLQKAIACASMFDNQHCGIYAGDWDSYKDFAEVFDPIIQEYHGISNDSKHTSNMDASQIKGNINTAAPVHSVRIRVGRSIDGFGLSPGITREQRLGVENLMKIAFKKLPGDLAGNYYALLGMDEKVRQQLVDDHFLFMSGDPNLKVAGMERDWPEGRGIFHNSTKTFLVWVNEEDQLRIISMEMGGDVFGVFERLARGIKAVGDSVKAESGKDFCLDPKYGYVHSCPTNLGTGMRASVHVDLPGWTAEGLNALKARCEQLKVQPRGTRGESGGQTGCTYDISNKHRLGYSEVELVQCMIDGVNTLYQEDIALQKKHGMYPAMPEIKSAHSLVAKYVTPQIWKQLADHKTATSGFTLRQACACALLFDNQHCGIYAGDWDSYKDFAAVFDPLIQEYHGIKPGAKHTSDMDVNKIQGNIDASVPVNSVRIRVGRSIDGFGLSPGITREQRLGVENLMKSAFKKLPGDLSGNYFPLLGMDEKIRQQLVDDHFLFMSGDPNLKVAGMERDWPEGRGIYHNAAKTFLVWVNEEDQLRIISMEMGGDVRGVFERLARGIKAVGDSVKAESGKDFCLDSKYGYVHSCPTNLGTGMRASVHVDLPGWTAKGLDALKKRCEELKVQPRGTRGESGGQTGCTYDISNKHRLGYSEVELVQCMIDGVNTLYKEDLALQKSGGGSAPMQASGPAGPFPNIKSKHSLVAKYVTPEVWAKLGGHVTRTSGFTLTKAIACAIEFDNQHCGIYAGDWDSYKDFAAVFDPLIQEYHGIKPGAKHTSDMDVTKIKGNIDVDVPVHSVRIRVGRSIDGFGLSPGITREQRVGVETLMKSAFKKMPGDLSGNYYPLTGMDEKVRQQLVDDHFLFMSGDPNLKVAGMERDWPEGRGIYHNKDKTFLVWVNEEDQLRIISMEMGGDVKGVFARLARGIKAVGDSVKTESGKDFCLDSKYGYVHSCPTNLGTGMRASVHADLPGWTKQGLDALKARCEELKVQPRGTRGESGGQTGVTYDISNKHRLGYSEVELVQCMIDGVNTLYREDIQLQQKHGIFPYFPEIKSKHSLVAKHVTEARFKKLGAHKTATSGFTLQKAIACAAMFDNQHCGIYAGDWDSYRDFAEVFDPIIQEYHGISPDAKHTSNMDAGQIKGNINPNAPVHSVRIRVGRSIDGFGLSPGITRQQRVGVENLMKTAFKKLPGDLAGNYYPLLGMDEKIRQQLVDDHFLFVSGDPNLKVAGMERDWPEGRGIFHNSAKSFLVWVNEEDQLRIISMEMGGDVFGVFERLARGIKAVQDSVKAESGKDFCLDTKYGYIHSCPTNLGTGMRASVHVDLPGWTTEGVNALKARCEQLKVQPRGTRGESGGQTGCTYDISNKHRLGYSEVELVQCMIDGVNTLYQEDVALQKKHGIFPAMPEIKSAHSLVAKHVTPKVWKQLADHTTATAGFTLRKACACALLFDNQHCGIYAGDWDSYKDFAAVFDPIIQEYHGIKPGAVHTSDMDVNKIKGNIDANVPVNSVRIRVGRSIDGFGLSPGITREQRLGVENLMKSAFKKLSGDLAGNYFPLLGMDEKIRQQLVDDHFLFVSGDPNLKVAGMERDWPEGRGIYHNAAKTFLVWVNEEDQLRIISMEMGGDVRGVFERLARGIKAVGDSVKAESGKDFCLDPKYGYVHSCPTNLGTGMRASVHVDLPGWTAKGLDALKRRCEELKVQPRGTRGESGGQTGCTYDISNKHRLGYSEVELVQCMIDGVNTLYKEDLELQKTCPGSAPTPKATMGTCPPFPNIKSKHSLVAKYVTPDIWAKLGGLTTGTSGFTLSKAIACAVEFDNQHCGIYAGDWDSYKEFAAVFDPLIQEYHGISPSARHTSDMDVKKIKGNIIPDVPVHSVRIRVGRSIDGFGLSPGITREQRLGVENLMKSAFTKMPGDLSGKYFPLTGMDEKVRQQLVDDHFLFMSGDPNLKVAGMERDWPEGRGIYHNKDKTFLVWVNEEDQLRIISMEMGGDVRGVFERLARGIKAVGDSVKAESGKEFCLDSKYGYVHSCPTNLGTGMRASVHVDLPGWTAEGLKALQARCEELKVQPRGTRGESGGQTGCTYDISNKHRLGYSEVELVQCMIDGVNTLYQEDIALQKKNGIFPFFPEIKSKHSLVAKHVTEARYKKLGAHKTATSGFTLQKAIACAAMFDNQHCGIYAGDWDSYKDFAEVFDPIIQEYHGISADAKHTSDMNPSKVQGNINPHAPVHSVRIRVGRSIDGFGLSPGITREQRVGVENLMRSAFKKLPGDLSGNYYPLLGMDEKVRQQLVDDHFLFVSGDPNLKVAGMERDWPEGRGIFHNQAKSFLVWVNEEDQLRIISMEMGGDVFGVFERLARGIKAVQESVKSESGRDFCLDAKYGYIHSCPTNLGTGMRASVHVDLPGWTAEGLNALKARCEQLKVQPRGTRGESGGQTGCTFDISNKHRLGYSEVELVQCMIDGVNTLYQEDIALQKKHGIFPAMPEIKSTHSLVAKHVTPQVWKQLGAHTTATSGFTLRKACACALLFDNQHCGIYAGDWDSYKDFAAIFDPIIQEYHGIKPSDVHTSDMDVSKIKGNINANVPVKSVRIRVGRSIDGFGLSPGITRDQRLGVENLMKSAFQKLSGDLSGKYYPLLGMDERVRQQLVDDHFLFMSGDPNLKVAGMERDWPEGRGIYHNAAKTFLVWVNEEDQLRIISMEMGGDVRGVFERLARGIKAVGDSVMSESGKGFMLDPKYGYVHSCPTNLGTGMRASVHVDLPGWTAHSIDALKRRCEELKVQPRGTRGESGGQTGCTYDISNKHRLGYSEVELVQCMIDGVNTLYKEDLELQKSGAGAAPVQASGPAPQFPNIKSKHSLVAKHVTPDKWAKLGGHVTKTAGFTLSKAIACAVEFDNQHCGIYAGDWDSYKDFAAVFDPLIQEYHGISADARHTSDMDVTKINGNINVDVPVHSVRIRVGRSIDGFGLSPGITKQQRLGVESLMKSAFKKMPGDLAGNYYPLTGMDEKIRQQLVDDHFLFMSGDRNLTVAGMERDWPEGRGIYHNALKTFLVWVNEEDQLRIISMEMGGDVRGVFERLARGIKAVGDSVKAESGKDFCLDAKYGYIHSCPTNLGTGMRASVHVDLPGWTQYGLEKLQKRCEELKVQPRGTRGESGGQTGCTYDISNKHRLGYSEVELVQCMIDGVNSLYHEDIALQQKLGIYPVMPEIKSKHSLVAKHVTAAKWKKLGGLKTKTSGFNLRKAIACAVTFDNQHCGIYAGDWDSYKDFAAVFDPIIQEYHGIDPNSMHTSDMDVAKIQGNIYSDAPVHSVRIRVGRSIEGFGLSPGITREQRIGMESLMKSAFCKLSGDLAGKYFPLLGMDEITRQKLVDDHFLFMSGDPNLKIAGMERDWPEGRGIFHNAQKTFLVWVNEEDQLRIISMQLGGDVRMVFDRLARGIKGVQESVKAESGRDFMLDPKYGYIHSCPTNLGTGMRASVHIDLPGWTREGIPALKARCEQLKVQPRGTRGESGGQTGCTYDISNKHRLGYSEVELVQCMINGVNTLFQEDLALQKKHGM